ncbi:hypothetical protein B0J14DRAFT_564499 [Halenospora varia]|nr:hypothetical protein B0J14DRAFT_564499 [Halenospora varia]
MYPRQLARRTFPITNLGPLTTLWTPPESCQATTHRLYGGFYQYNFDGETEIFCWPPVTGVVSATITHKPGTQDYIPRYSHLYYSPALCPSGWVGYPVSTFLYAQAITSSTSASVCCPTGYRVVRVDGELCQSIIESGAVITSLLFTHETAGLTELLDITTASDRYTMQIYPINVMWHSTDIEVVRLLQQISTPISFSSSKTSVTTTGSLPEPSHTTIETSSIALSTIPAASSTPTEQSISTKSSVLGGGAKAGIAIGVLVVLCASSLVLFFLLRRRGFREIREAKEKLQDQSIHELSTTNNLYEMDNRSKPRARHHRDSCSDVVENYSPSMDAEQGTVEPLGNTHDVFELDSTNRHTSRTGSKLDCTDIELDPGQHHDPPLSLTTDISSNQENSPASLVPGPTIPLRVHTQEGTPINDAKQKKIEILKDRIDRIRAETEKLEEDQKFKDSRKQAQKQSEGSQRN